MSNKLLISVIIPVYHADVKTSEILLSSINNNNNLDNIEFIFIENGSKSNFKSYIAKYKNIKNYQYFYVEEANVSLARNIGINNSNGKYITFIDYDDYISNLWSEKIICYTSNHQYDFIFFDFSTIKHSDNNTKVDRIKLPTYNSITDLINGILNNRELRGYLWNKLFLKEIIVKNNLSFNKDFSFQEDLLFVLQYVKQIRNFTSIKEDLYYYVMNTNSLSRTYSNKYLMDKLLTQSIVLTLVPQTNIHTANISYLKSFCQFYVLNKTIKKANYIQFLALYNKIKKETKSENYKHFIYKHYKIYKLLSKIFKKL